MSDYKLKLHEINSLDKNIKIAFVSWSFNEYYVEKLEQENHKFLNENWFYKIDKYRVPWVFEVPWFTRKILDKKHYDLILCLWVVVRWETTHYDYVAWQWARAIMDLSLKYDTPVIFWLLTCENVKQVEQRLNPSASISWLNLLLEVNKI